MKKKLVPFILLTTIICSNLFAQIKGKTTAPVLLIDEDFTDGAFDDYNAGETGNNWSIYGGGDVDFKTPNLRTDFSRSLARCPFGGGHAWSGAQWKIIADTAGNYQEFFIHKQDDITILKFTAFSDYLHSNNYAGVEVAMLEYRQVLCPHPDYCHDLSYESMQCFYAPPGNGGKPTQLETNVENTANTNPTGVNYAHKNDWFNEEDLGKTYENLVIWRNMPGTGKTNIEQWGTLNSADFNVDKEMNSMLDPNNIYSIFSYVQIALFRNDADFNLLRTEATKENAQIGITHLEVGITKKCDFNIDYAIDPKDADTLVKYLGQTSTTIKSGDATNDKLTDIRDATSLIAFWGNEKTIGKASATYNSSTGELKISGENISSFYLENKAASFNGSASFTGLLPKANQANDSVVGAFTLNKWTLTQHNLGNIGKDISLSDLKLVVNFKGSQVGYGFEIPLTGIEAPTYVGFNVEADTIAADNLSHNLTVKITNPSSTDSTRCIIKLIEGNSADLNNFTTDTIAFAAGSDADKLIPLTITGDSLLEKKKHFTFVIHKVDGGYAAASNEKDTLRLHFKESPVVEINKNTDNTINILIFPNPIKNELNILLSNPPKGKATYTIFNEVGTLIAKYKINCSGNKQLISKNINQLKKGIYLVKITFANGQTITTKFIITP